MGWKKLKSFTDNWLECKSWINSGNYLIIEGIKVSFFDGDLKASLLEQQK